MSKMEPVADEEMVKNSVGGDEEAYDALAQPPNVELSDHELMPKIVAEIREIFDPEIPVNIYDLGLIYDVKVDENYFVDVSITLTAPACPVAETFPGTVENAVKGVRGVSDARVELTFDPPWTTDNMSEEAKLELGMI